MPNMLLDPPFATNPPVKLNIDAKILGLVLAILACIGALLALLAGGLFAAFAFVGGFTLIWVLGSLVTIVGYIVGAVGGFQMFNGNRAGKQWLIYGLALGLLGAAINMIGTIIAYSGVSSICSAYVVNCGYSVAGPIVGFIISAIVLFILYYLVVISRFPGDAPLAARGGFGGTGYGGYGGPGGTPPPPPPA